MLMAVVEQSTTLPRRLQIAFSQALMARTKQYVSDAASQTGTIVRSHATGPGLATALGLWPHDARGQALNAGRQLDGGFITLPPNGT